MKIDVCTLNTARNKDAIRTSISKLLDKQPNILIVSLQEVPGGYLSLPSSHVKELLDKFFLVRVLTLLYELCSAVLYTIISWLFTDKISFLILQLLTPIAYYRHVIDEYAQTTITQLGIDVTLYNVRYFCHGSNMLLICHQKHLHSVNIVSTDAISCGYLNMLPNKGALAVRLSIDNKLTIDVFSAHLSAYEGEKYYRRRNSNMNNILSRCNFNRNDKVDCVLFVGDLNYRLGMQRERYDELVSTKSNIGTFFAFDELRRATKEKEIVSYFTENHIDFIPSYKLKKPLANKDVRKFDDSVYSRKRLPAWCDRILFARDSNTKCDVYKCATVGWNSDHLPVVASLQIEPVETRPKVCDFYATDDLRDLKAGLGFALSIGLIQISTLVSLVSLVFFLFKKNDAFKDTEKIEDEEILNGLVSICRMFNLSPEKLHIKWESFVLSSKDNNTKICHALVEKFRSWLKANMEDSSMSSTTLTSSVPKKRILGNITQTLNKDSFGQLLLKKASLPQNTPVKHVQKHRESTDQQTPSRTTLTATMEEKTPNSNFQQQTPNVNFSQRKNSGKVEIQLNPNLKIDSKPALSCDKPRCEIAAYPSFLLEGYKFMYDKQFDRGKVVDARINDMQDRIIDAYKIDRDEIGHPGQASQFPIKTVGKIMSDSSNKLNEKSVLFETSCDAGAARVYLNLDAIPSFSLFPGQILGLDGVNNTGGNQFHVKSIYEPPLPDLESSALSDLYAFNYGKDTLNGEPLQMISACGPFTGTNDFSFEHLHFLLSECVQNVDVLVLMGPFIDENHPLLESPEFDLTGEEVFSRNFLIPILEFMKRTPTLQIVLIPSCQDFIHPWCVFPQPPLQISNFLDSDQRLIYKTALERLVSLSNPSIFAINEISIGIMSDDVLLELSREEISRFPANELPKPDRMARFIRHLLSQQSFYPLIPVGMENSKNLPVDYGQMKHAKIYVRPDIILMPSKLSIFAKIVENCVAINPGPLVRGKSDGGTFAKISVLPLDKENFSSVGQSENEAEMFHGLQTRTRVEIIRL